MTVNRQDALDYHSTGRPGKIAVVPTKPALTARDLSLAYSPGVPEPCREISCSSWVKDLSCWEIGARTNGSGVES